MDDLGDIEMIGAETANEGAALLSTAIAELTEDASADAVRMEQDGMTVWVIKAERLQAVGLDVATLAQAIQVLARNSESPGD